MQQAARRGAPCAVVAHLLIPRVAVEVEDEVPRVNLVPHRPEQPERALAVEAHHLGVGGELLEERAEVAPRRGLQLVGERRDVLLVGEHASEP